jgi:hypothetical protein
MYLFLKLDPDPHSTNKLDTDLDPKHWLERKSLRNLFLLMLQ